jgi:hypothetical protein
MVVKFEPTGEEGYLPDYILCRRPKAKSFVIVCNWSGDAIGFSYDTMAGETHVGAIEFSSVADAKKHLENSKLSSEDFSILLFDEWLE